MLRRALFSLIFLLSAVAVSAQAPFDEIHGDLIRKLEAARARRAFRAEPFLAPRPTPNQLLYDAVHYLLDIAIDPTTRLLNGYVEMSFTPTSGALDSIDVDLDDVLTISAIHDARGSLLAWKRSNGIVTINLAATLAPGDTTTVTFSYGGYPSNSSDPGLFFSSYGGYPVIYSLSEPWSARAWWPCKDYPDDKATFEIYLSVPVALTAASNGTYLGYSDETRWSAPFRRYHWRESYPMATYLASIAASDYTILKDNFVYAPGDTLPVTHYVYPALATQAQTDFSITVPALTFFSQIFGLYPFITEKYGVALCSIGGGMENQTLTSYGGFLVRGDHYYDYVFVHEMSHMWLGDMITCKDWTNVWLNEGFASYAEALWFEHVQGPAKLKSYMETKDRPSLWHGPVLRDPDNTNPDYYFDNVVYYKGAWVLHMLRHIVGDSTFFHIFKDYCGDGRLRFSEATTSDFRGICESHYGSSLGWFFNEWLTRTDRLTYRWSQKAYAVNGALNLTIAIDQAQDSLYAMPIDFRVTTVNCVLDTVFWVKARHEEFHASFLADDQVLSVAFDPGHWILCDKTEIVTGVTGVPSALYLAQNFPNPFNPRTTISFGLSEPAKVVLQVFDVRGSLVKTIVDGERPAGAYRADWDGTDARGKQLPSGVYFCRLITPSREISRKMLLVR